MRSSRRAGYAQALSQLADEVLRDDEVVGGVDENPGAGAASLTGRAGFGVADVPDEVVVNLVLLLGGFDVDGRADGEDVREDIAGDAAIDVAAVEPEAIGVPDMANDIIAKQHVSGVVKLGAGGFPGALGVRPADPFNQVALEEDILGALAADALDAAVANGVAANDVEAHLLPRTRPAKAPATYVHAHAHGPFDGVAFYDPVMAALGGHQTVLRRRKTVARVLKGNSFDADVTEAALLRDERLLAGGDFDQRMFARGCRAVEC